VDEIGTSGVNRAPLAQPAQQRHGPILLLRAVTNPHHRLAGNAETPGDLGDVVWLSNQVRRRSRGQMLRAAATAAALPAPTAHVHAQMRSPTSPAIAARALSR
jgi:hypothetical protein